MHFRILLGLLLLSAAVASAERVSIAGFSGPSAAKARSQVVDAICAARECVSPTKTTTAKKPDWKKAQNEGVHYFVVGEVKKAKKRLTLEMTVLSQRKPLKLKKVFPLEPGTMLSAAQLTRAVDFLLRASGGLNAPPPAQPVRSEPVVESPPVAAPPREQPSPAPVATSAPPKEEPEAPPPEVIASPPPETAPATPPQRTTKFLIVDVGADVRARQLNIEEIKTPNLRKGYQLPPFGQPVVAVHFYPLALVRQDALAGLGISLMGSYAPYLSSSLKATDTMPTPAVYPTSTLRLDGGLNFRFVPFQTFALAITPDVGVRYHAFTIGASKDGQRLDGLPNVSYLGLRAGLSLEVPIIKERLALFGRFGVVPVFNSGEIISATFFPRGKAFGFEATGGLGVKLLPFVEVRASFEFTHYAMTFTTEVTDTYIASSATDTYMGGNASVRFSF